MSWILTTIKIISFLFPFLKELFSTRSNNTSRKGKVKEPNELLKNIIIVLGCISVAANFYLFTQAYNLGRENLELKRQAKETNPRPVQYPEDHSPTKLYRPHEAVPIDTTRHNNDNNRNKKPPNLPPVLPPDRETYLRELEEINQIH